MPFAVLVLQLEFGRRAAELRFGVQQCEPGKQQRRRSNAHSGEDGSWKSPAVTVGGRRLHRRCFETLCHTNPEPHGNSRRITAALRLPDCPRRHNCNQQYTATIRTPSEICRDDATWIQRTAGDKLGLVLPGGGARAAYQVGVLRAIADLLPARATNPFPVVTGTSAGAVNATAIAIHADRFRVAVGNLERVWRNFQVDQVFRCRYGAA